jgi:putative transposase
VYIPGGTYFFTLVTHERQPILCTSQAISRLRLAFKHVKNKHPFHIKGLVILPDHLHCIWQLPENDSSFSTRWNMIKRYFSLNIRTEINARREKNIWQKRFWEHFIRDEYDLEKHMDYIYYNPVKHGYVDSPSDWMYSTFRRDVKKGLYPMDWGSCQEPKRIFNMDCE